jgi:hypothetical protein
MASSTVNTACAAFLAVPCHFGVPPKDCPPVELYGGGYHHHHTESNQANTHDQGDHQSHHHHDTHSSQASTHHHEDKQTPDPFPQNFYDKFEHALHSR